MRIHRKTLVKSLVIPMALLISAPIFMTQAHGAITVTVLIKMTMLTYLIKVGLEEFHHLGLSKQSINLEILKAKRIVLSILIRSRFFG